MMNSITKKPLFWFLLVTVFTFFSFNSLLRSGYFPMHDDMQAMRVLQMDKCVKDGQLPCRWVPDMGYGYGYPQFNYYPPLPYYVMEFIHLGGFSILDSVKAGFVISFLLSAISMFILGRSLFGNVGGFISSLFYIYAPYRATNVFNRGAMGEVWAFIFLPLIFWSILEVIRKGKGRYVIYLALSYAGLLTTHLVTSLIFSPIALIWGIFLLWHFGKLKRIKKLFTGTIWGILLAGFFIFPVLFEKKYAHTETLTMGFFNYLAHYVSLRQIFTSTHWGFGSTELGAYDDFSFSIGILHWLFGALAVIVAFIYRAKNSIMFKLSIFLTLVTLGSLFMTHQRSVLIWNSLSVLSYLQFPWRFLVIAVFSISILAGIVVYFTEKRATKAIITLLMVIGVIFFNAFYFYPREWFVISDKEKFSGELWDKQQTISIFDYLPIYAEQPPSDRAPVEPQIVEGEADVISGQSGTNKQNWKINVTSDLALVRLSLYDFPGWKVWVNSEEVSINHDNKLGLITFSLNQGENEIEVRLTDTPVRSVGNLTSIVGLIAIPLFLSRERKKK